MSIVGKGADSVIDTAKTGARELSVDEFLKQQSIAEDMYKNIRSSTSDISDIAKQTGLPEWKIERIKNHVFNNEHDLGGFIGQFDADYDMAQAWKRLQNGTFNSNDLDLLNHEYFESKFESIFGTNYGTAHGKTIESGRIWNPDK